MCESVKGADDLIDCSSIVRTPPLQFTLGKRKSRFRILITTRPTLGIRFMSCLNGLSLHGQGVAYHLDRMVLPPSVSFLLSHQKHVNSHVKYAIEGPLAC